MGTSLATASSDSSTNDGAKTVCSRFSSDQECWSAPPKTRVQTNWCLSVREEWVKQCMKNMDSGEQLHRLLPCFRDGSRRYELLVEQIWLFGLFFVGGDCCICVALPWLGL